MKRVIVLLLTLAMLAGIATIGANAVDGVYVHTNFETMEEFMKYFVPGAFFVQDNMVYGYSEAKALNSLYKEDENGVFLPGPTVWTNFDAYVNIAAVSDTDGDRSLSFWYCNDTPAALGYAESRQYVYITYHIADDLAGYFTMTTHNPYTDEDQLLAQSAKTYELDFDSDGSTFYRLGFSVGPNRIRAFLGDECVCEYNDVYDGFGIGTEAPSAFVLWNSGNMVLIKEFESASYGYIYPLNAPAPVESSSTESAEPVTSVVSSVSEVVVTDDKGETVTNEKGEAVTETVIVTEVVTVAPADTQSNAGNGGHSTTTGDTAFIVLAVMIVALGSAIIVKKVTVR